MTEGLSVVFTDYFTKIVSVGIGTGTVLGLIAILGGYAISRALSLVDR